MAASRTALLVLLIGTTCALAAQAKAKPPLVLKDGTRLNLAYEYDTDFHVAFAIITFTTLLFFLPIFGVSLGMWFMDPGRDSIIYRMTSQRMKKDQ